MAIYIKGIEMPKGDDCTILTVYSDGVVYLRQYKDKMCLDDSTNATAVPEPHGRLIDADWFFNTFAELESYNTEANAPTVIEGSE